MGITRLGLNHFRNIAGADLETDSPFVVVYGPNGAGKTSILEAIHLLLAGRSFRTRESSKLISHSQAETVVSAKIDGHQLGTSRSMSNPALYRLDAETVHIAQIARQFPVQVLDNRLFDLFEGPPRQRRQLLDWGVFHVKHDFYHHWQRYQHALKQRNALLKSSGAASKEQIDSWDQELIHHGEYIHQQRKEYVDQLAKFIHQSPLLNNLDLEFDYSCGWNSREHEHFSAALLAARPRDIQYKRTTLGPQQADFRIRLSSRRAGDVLSRGQKKLAGFAIKLAQVKMYNDQLDKRCILLCDDFSAELDIQNQQLILGELIKLDSQVFLTIIEPQQLVNYLTDLRVPVQLFHVKQGSLVHENP